MGRDLGDLDHAHAAAGRLLVSRAGNRSPRVSGALGASLQADVAGDGFAITSALPYFGPIHQGWPARNIEAQPFVVDTVVAAEAEVVDVYAEDVDDTLSHFKHTY